MFYPELEGTALDAHKRMVDKLVAMAQKEMGLGIDDLSIRPLIPADLLPGISSTTSDYLYGQTANAFTSIGTPAITTVAMADNRFVGINGVHNGQASGSIAEVGWSSLDAGSSGGNKVPSLRQLRVTRKGSTSRIWDIEPLYDFKNKTGWVDDPIIIEQNVTYTLEGLSRVAASIRIFSLLGVTVEKKG